MTWSTRLRLRGLVEYLRGAMWFLPALAILAAVVAAEVAVLLPNPGGGLIRRLLDIDVDGARAMLAAIAGSVITVTGLVFSLLIVSLQLASQQFSPRLMRTFMRDVGTQVVLSVFLATFAYALAVLPAVRGGQEPHVPQIAVAGAFLMALASVAGLVYFVHHATTEIRVDAMMRDVERETLHTIERVYSRLRGADVRAAVDAPALALPVSAPSSGFVQDVALPGLVEMARSLDVVVRLHMPIGDYVVAGAPLAWAWACDGGAPAPEACDRLRTSIGSAVQIGYERTQQGDVGFGIRQLVDVAVKALSPAINDPTTAVHAVGRLTALLWALGGRCLDAITREDRDGTVRACVPSRRFDEFLELACGQIRRYGASEPAVTTALLQMLAVVAGAVDTDSELAAIWHEGELVIAAARESTRQAPDLISVEAAWDALGRAIRGDRRPISVDAS